MKGISKEIKISLDILIDGLSYDFTKTGTSLADIEPERMKSIAKAKLTSLNGAKGIINRWLESPNRPTDKTIIIYIERIINAVDSSLKMLRTALTTSIDFDILEAHKHDAAIAAKPVILETLLDLDKESKELRDKIDNNDLSFSEREFTLGYPERFGKGEIIDISKYYKQRLTEEGDVIIDPLSTQGKKVVIDNLGIILPKQPKKENILFHDLPKSEQFWKKPEIPEINLNNVEYYEEHIKEEFRRRREGVWFYNNGVPTYLTGHHYFGLTYCKMLDSGGYMNYREAQRDLFYFIEACLVDNRSLGVLFGKSRRTGFTYCAIVVKMNRATTMKNTKHGLMSKTGEDGKEVFSKESYMFLNLPFYFRPVVRGKLDSPKELYFGSPADNSKEKKKSKKIELDDYMNTSMDWRPTKNGSYDSIKLDTYLLDEVFKIEAPNDVITHMGMIAPTMMPSGRVVGKMLAGSTMGIHSKGGEQGVELINNSKVEERDPSTEKTTTGLYFHFLPAHKNMEEFTDKYGKCWTEKPKRKTLNVFGDPIIKGSLDHLLAIEAQKKKQSEKAYNEQIRTYPRTLDHMMRDDSSECVFNMEKIIGQIDHNDTLPKSSLYTTGDFEWEDGVADSKVIFHPKENGRFKISWMPSVADGTQHLQNRIKEVDGQFFPLNNELVRFGCDPYTYAGKQGSKGGIHGKTVYLPEATNVPKNEFVLEYIARPANEITFFEDVIKCIKFYGSPILVERNRKALLRHMYTRGYRGFAMNRLDRTFNKLSEDERKYGGQTMSGEDILDAHIGAIGTYVQNHVGEYNDEVGNLRELGKMGNMPFNATLNDWLKFNPSKRTEYDATISSGLAIMACQENKYKKKEIKRKKVNINTLFPKYSNKGNHSQKIK